MTFKESFLNFILRTYLFANFKFNYSFDPNFDPKRTDPYLLLGNHSSLIDGLYTSIPLYSYPFPVINVFMYNKPLMKFVLTKLIHSIPKRKGQSDIATIRSIFDTIKNQNRGVMLFPEGNASYFGKESEIPYSTAKLIKKLKLDVVICLANGGYLSNPRWSDRPVKGGTYDVHYYTLLTAAELEKIDQDELYHKIVEALRFNDFEYNRIHRHKYSQAHRAEGLERFVYACPNCGNTQSIYTKKNRIYCKHCGKIAEFNEYSFLEGLPFDNLIDWDRFQKPLIPEIVKRPLKSSAVMNIVELPSNKCIQIGKFDVVLDREQLKFANDKQIVTFQLSDIVNLTLTRKEELSFDHQDKTYFVAFKDPMLFFDAINYLNGGNS